MNPTKYAARQGVSRQSVLKAIKVGRLGESVTRDAKGHYEIDPKLADAEWEGATDPTRKPVITDAPAAPAPGESFLDAKARRERALATMAEIELKRRGSELVLATDVERELALVLSHARTKLLSLPTRLRGDIPEIGAKGFVIATEIVRGVLTDLADGLEAIS